MAKILDQIKDLKNIKPNKDWARAEREVLLSQITKQSSAQPRSFLVDGYYLLKSFMPGNLLQLLARPIGVFLIATLIITGSGILSVSAAKSSLPGDLLYSIKLATEKVAVTLTKEEKKAEKHIEFAANRVQEIEEINLQEDEKENKKEKIAVATEGLTKEVSKVKEVLETSRQNQDIKKADEIVEAAKNVDFKVDQLKKEIAEMIISLGDESKEIFRELVKTTDLLDETAIVAMDVLIEKYDKGEVELNERELMESIGEIIKEAREGINELEQPEVSDEQKETEVKEESSQEEKALIGDSEIIEEENEDIGSTSEIDPEASEEESVVNEMENEDKEDQVSVEKLDELDVVQQDNTEKASQLLDEAEGLVSQGDMVNAMNKIKQSKVLVLQIRKVAGDMEKEREMQEEKSEEENQFATESETVEINESNDENSDIESEEDEQEPNDLEELSTSSEGNSLVSEQEEKASSANEVKKQEQAKY